MQRLARGWYYFTLCLLLLGHLSVQASEVPHDPSQARPLPVGAAMPDFTARTVAGKPFKVSAKHLERPLVLIFYRGGWCPYCNAHLAQLRDTEPQLRALGFEVLFLSADRPEALRSSLKEPDVGYTLLSDSRMEVARAFGIAFRVDDARVRAYRMIGINLEEASGEQHHMLPVPSVFIVDRGGIIRFVYSNPNYKVRIKAAELLAAARGVVSTQQRP